jgi:hypothetical protein
MTSSVLLATIWIGFVVLILIISLVIFLIGFSKWLWKVLVK